MNQREKKIKFLEKQLDNADVALRMAANGRGRQKGVNVAQLKARRNRVESELMQLTGNDFAEGELR